MMRDKLIQHAIRQSYGHRLGKEQLPEYVIFIDLPAKDVDVNLHPAKHEVRFHHARLLHDLLVKTIEDALSGFTQPELLNDEAPNFISNVNDHSSTYAFENSMVQAQVPVQDRKQEKSDYKQPLTSASEKGYHGTNVSRPSSFSGLKSSSQQSIESVLITPNREIDHDKLKQARTEQTKVEHTENEQTFTVNESYSNISEDSPSELSILFIQQQRFVYVQYANDVWLLDAEHLVTNDAVDTNINDSAFVMTPLLVPVRIRLNKEEQVWCQQHQEVLTHAGFDIKLHQPFLIIKQVPNALRQDSGQTVPQLFNQIMTGEQTDESLKHAILNRKAGLMTTEQIREKLLTESKDNTFIQRFCQLATKLDSKKILGIS